MALFHETPENIPWSAHRAIVDELLTQLRRGSGSGTTFMERVHAGRPNAPTFALDVDAWGITYNRQLFRSRFLLPIPVAIEVPEGHDSRDFHEYQFQVRLVDQDAHLESIETARDRASAALANVVVLLSSLPCTCTQLDRCNRCQLLDAARS